MGLINNCLVKSYNQRWVDLYYMNVINILSFYDFEIYLNGDVKELFGYFKFDHTRKIHFVFRSFTISTNRKTKTKTKKINIKIDNISSIYLSQITKHFSEIEFNCKGLISATIKCYHIKQFEFGDNNLKYLYLSYLEQFDGINLPISLKKLEVRYCHYFCSVNPKCLRLTQLYVESCDDFKGGVLPLNIEEFIISCQNFNFENINRQKGIKHISLHHKFNNFKEIIIPNLVTYDIRFNEEFYGDKVKMIKSLENLLITECKNFNFSNIPINLKTLSLCLYLDSELQPKKLDLPDSLQNLELDRCNFGDVKIYAKNLKLLYMHCCYDLVGDNLPISITTLIAEHCDVFNGITLHSTLKDIIIVDCHKFLLRKKFKKFLVLRNGLLPENIRRILDNLF